MVIILWNYPAKRQVPYKTNINFIYWQYICCLLWRTYAEKSNTVIYWQQLWIFQFKKMPLQNWETPEALYIYESFRDRELFSKFTLKNQKLTCKLSPDTSLGSTGARYTRYFSSSVKPLVAENKGESYVTDKDLVKTCWLKPDATHKQCFEI